MNKRRREGQWSDLKSLTSFAGFTLVRQLVGFLSVFFANVLASTHMSSSSFASYISVSNVAFGLAGVSTLGLYPTVLYQLSQNKAITRPCSFFLLRMATIAASCTVGLLMAWQAYLGLRLELASCVLTASLVFSSALPAIFIALHRVAAYNVSELSWQVTYLLLVLLLEPASPNALLWIFALSSSLRAILYFFFLMRIPEFRAKGDLFTPDWSYFRDSSVASVAYILFFRLSFYVPYLSTNGAVLATGWSWLERLLGLSAGANAILSAKVAAGTASRKAVLVFVSLVAGAFLAGELVLVAGAALFERFVANGSYHGLTFAALSLAPGFLLFVVRSNLQSVLMGLGHAKQVRANTIACVAGVACLVCAQWFFPTWSLLLQSCLLFLLCASVIHYARRLRREQRCRGKTPEL